MPFLYANNAITTLAAGIGTTDTSFVVQNGTGSKFPAFAPSTPGLVSLYDSATSTNIEIVKVTSRVGDTFTVIRAQEGTAAKSYVAGDKVGQELTAGQISDFASQASGAVFQSPIFAPTAATADNSTQVATTAFVKANVGTSSGTGVTSFNSRTGVVTLQGTDINQALTYTPASTSGGNYSGRLTSPGFTASGSGGASVAFVDSAAGTDLKTFDMNAVGGVFNLRAVNDAASAAQNILSITRTGTTPLLATWYAPVALQGSSTGRFGFNVVNSDASGGNWSFGVSGSAGVSSNTFYIYDKAAAIYRFTIDSAGNVQLPNGRLFITDTTGFALNLIGISAGSGCNISMTGQGNSTPKKYLRTYGGHFQVVNDGYTQVIFDLDDTGALLVTGALTAASLNITSSAALKTDFREVSGALDSVLKWKPKTYRLKASPDRVRTGLVVEESPSNIVDDKTIDLYAMVTTLASAVQELTKEVRAKQH